MFYIRLHRVRHSLWVCLENSLLATLPLLLDSAAAVAGAPPPMSVPCAHTRPYVYAPGRLSRTSACTLHSKRSKHKTTHIHSKMSQHRFVPRSKQLFLPEWTGQQKECQGGQLALLLHSLHLDRLQRAASHSMPQCGCLSRSALNPNWPPVPCPSVPLHSCNRST